MGTSKIREDLKQYKPVDFGAILDTIDQFTTTVADLTEKLATVLSKIDELSKSKKLDESYSVDTHEKR